MVVASSDLVKPLHEQSILDGVLAHAKYVLGRIRCKYSGVPGPNDKEIIGSHPFAESYGDGYEPRRVTGRTS